MIVYRMHDTPVGRLLIASTEEGIVRVAFECEHHDLVLAQLASHLDESVVPACAGEIDRVVEELDEYFSGKRREFTVPLDTTRVRCFQRKVLDSVTDIPYGSTKSYSEVADDIGHHNAMRSVGTACATNPIPVVIPCHRVTPASGRLGQFVGGPAAKKVLLELESMACSPAESSSPG